MIRDTSAFSLSSCPKASLTWVRGSARDENSVHPSGSISARITMGPAHVSTIAPFGVVVCHGANWYEAPISKFSLRNSSSVRLNRGRNRPRRQGHRAGTGYVARTPGEANVTRRWATGGLKRTGGIEGDRRRFCHRASLVTFRRFGGDTVWCPNEAAAYDLE